MDLCPTRVLSPPHIPILLQRHIKYSQRDLNSHLTGFKPDSSFSWDTGAHNGPGRTRTFGVSLVTDLQSALLAAGVTDPGYKKTACVEITLQTDGLNSMIPFR